MSRLRLKLNCDNIFFANGRIDTSRKRLDYDSISKLNSMTDNNLNIIVTYKYFKYYCECIQIIPRIILYG